VNAHAARAFAPAGICARRLGAPPDLVALHAAQPARYPHLLQSTAHGTPHGRFDILFAFPGASLTLTPAQRLVLNDVATPQNDFLSAFDTWWRTEAQPPVDTDTFPFRGGWFVFLAYELAAQIEPRVAALITDNDFPIAMATRFPAAIIHDHARAESHAIAEAGQEPLLDLLVSDASRRYTDDAPSWTVRTAREDNPEEFLAGVGRVQSYICAGDVFQVNLSRGWRIDLADAPAPAALYRRLRAANPAPFAGIATWANGHAIVSSSPERLVQVRDRTVHTRPIAGTYPRSSDAGDDAQRARELLAHPKERAEHVMLIDLERNDIGRVCRPGTVRVNELMGLESYRHVHHIVSEIVGELRDDVGPAQVLRAVFPGGTITGCPKIRCMEIIAELERTPRGAYTGSMGYINRDGSMDFNILIRTLTQAGTTLRWRAGAGIVADSVPARELQETRIKARGVATALEPGP
jgi:anthranilate synthase component I